MATECRVHDLHQARCRLCEWSGEITGDRGTAAYDAKVHRDSAEHKGQLREARAAAKATR